MSWLPYMGVTLPDAYAWLVMHGCDLLPLLFKDLQLYTHFLVRPLLFISQLKLEVIFFHLCSLYEDSYSCVPIGSFMNVPYNLIHFTSLNCDQKSSLVSFQVPNCHLLKGVPICHLLPQTGYLIAITCPSYSPQMSLRFQIES